MADAVNPVPSRPLVKGNCWTCGDQVIDPTTLVMVLCPSRPDLKHVQFTCRQCGGLRKVSAPTVTPTAVQFAGGRLLVVTWVDELDDKARRVKAPLCMDDCIDWHFTVQEMVTLKDWETTGD